jgi:glycosyltransferase involved in cell wall biosynthesis
MEPVRVLFVSHDAGLDGAQRTLLTLLSAIDRRVCSPLLVVPYDGPMNRAAAELGIPVFVERLVHWIPGFFVSSRRQRIRHLYLFFRSLRSRCRAIERLIMEQGVDLVYTNTVTCVEGAIAARCTRKPHVWHIHEHISGNEGIATLLPFRIYCTTIKFLSRAVIFCSRAVASDYPQLSGRASIVYNGLPLNSRRDRIAVRAEVTNELGIVAGAKIVAMVGALHPGKDHETFLSSAEQVARSVGDVIFLIVGAGSERYTSAIRRRIRDLQLDSMVRLLGWRDDILDLMAASDVLVVSSEKESFGLTVIEALAVETPVVSTRCGGPEEILEDGVTGLLVPVKDPLAMAEAIVRLLSDPVFARRMGANGRIHVLEHFGVDRYVQGIQRVIQEASSTQR